MVMVQCSECGQEFDFPHHVPTPGKEIHCIQCENSPLRLEMWFKATKDPTQKKEIVNRLAALKLKPKSRSRF